MGLFLETLADHLSAFPNLSEKWRQFHFALAGQIRGPLANCFELFAKQLRCGVRRSRVIRFTNSGKRMIEGHCNELNPYPETKQATNLHLPDCISSPSVSFL